jgi:hypothetical protein
VPTTPAGSGDVVVTLKVGALIVMLKIAVAVFAGDSESVTVTVKLVAPVVVPVGVPEITPALLKLKPAGRVPGGTLHV